MARTGLSWLAEWSVEAVRGALAAVVPELAGRPIALQPAFAGGSGLWSTNCAVIDARWVAKFALSEATAVRVRREAQVLEALAGRPDLPVPEVVAASETPVFFLTRRVEGEPLSYEMVGAAIPRRIDDIAAELARFFSALHGRDIPELVADALGAPVTAPDPGPQAATDELRTRLPPYIRTDQAELLRRWCAWVDVVLAQPGEPVFVHGDLHGYNQVWDARELRLRLVADFETSGAAEAEYDFRYLPALGPGIDLLTATAAEYERGTRPPLGLARVMAWHVRTALGDALWRSEAGVPLPGGGTPAGYVDGLSGRLQALGIAL